MRAHSARSIGLRLSPVCSQISRAHNTSSAPPSDSVGGGATTVTAGSPSRTCSHTETKWAVDSFADPPGTMHDPLAVNAARAFAQIQIHRADRRVGVGVMDAMNPLRCALVLAYGQVAIVKPRATQLFVAAPDELDPRTRKHVLADERTIAERIGGRGVWLVRYDRHGNIVQPLHPNVAIVAARNAHALTRRIRAMNVFGRPEIDGAHHVCMPARIAQVG